MRSTSPELQYAMESLAILIEELLEPADENGAPPYPVEELAPGVYYYRLDTKKYYEIKPFIKIK